MIITKNQYHIYTFKKENKYIKLFIITDFTDEDNDNWNLNLCYLSVMPLNDVFVSTPWETGITYMDQIEIASESYITRIIEESKAKDIAAKMEIAKKGIYGY